MTREIQLYEGPQFRAAAIGLHIMQLLWWQ